MAEDPNPANSAATDELISPAQKRKDDIALRRWTMAGLSFAVVLGVVVCASHGGTITVSLAAFGATLGVGGVLGFLFGIPGPKTATSSQDPARTNGPGPKAAPAVPRAGVAQAAELAGGHADAQAGAQVADPNQPQPAQNPGAGNGPAPLPDATPAISTPAPSTGRTSNLEQVADWVTKLLLGGGLTQMQRIPPKIWQWSHVVAVGILDKASGTSEQIIVAEQAFACGLMVYGFVLGFFAGFLITKLQLGSAISDS